MVKTFQNKNIEHNRGECHLVRAHCTPFVFPVLTALTYTGNLERATIYFYEACRTLCMKIGTEISSRQVRVYLNVYFHIAKVV